MENRKSRKSTFLYVILLTLCVPLAYVYLILVTGLLDKIQEGHIGLMLMIVFLPLFFLGTCGSCGNHKYWTVI